MKPEGSTRDSERGRGRGKLAVAAIVFVASAFTLALLLVNLQRRAPTADPALEADRTQLRGRPLPGELDRAPAPRFELTDARGGALGTEDLRGRPYVVTFMCTGCRDVTPDVAAQLRDALAKLGPRGRRLAVLAVSAEPAGDTREAVRRWLREQRMPENFHYLIGSRRDLRPVWDAYFVAPQPPDLQRTVHNTGIWLVDATGRLRTRFLGEEPVPPQDVVHDLGVLLDEAAEQEAG